MDTNEFWNMLSEENKEKANEMLNDYNGSDGVIGRIFELYEEGANSFDLTVEDYLEVIEPNTYVEYYYEGYVERETF